MDRKAVILVQVSCELTLGVYTYPGCIAKVHRIFDGEGWTGYLWVTVSSIQVPVSHFHDRLTWRVLSTDSLVAFEA